MVFPDRDDTAVDSENQNDHKSYASPEDGRATSLGMGESRSYLKPKTRTCDIYADSSESMGPRVLRLVGLHFQ